METIDVLLPYYGDVGHLKTATGSVLAQDYPKFRLVVLDDAYPSAEPARWFPAMSDARVIYIHNETNLGANRNFQKALGMAEAPILVMMGADDVMLPSYLKTVASVLAAYPEISVVQPGVEVIDGEGNRTITLTDTVKRFATPKARRPVRTITGEEMAASLLRAGWHYFPSLAWRTQAIGQFGFKADYDVVQDLALLMDIAAAGGSMAVMQERLFQYRRHLQSDSSVRAIDGRRFAEEKAFFHHEAERFRALGWMKAARAADLHLTSRLHAMVLLMRVGVRHSRPTVSNLARHIVF